MNPPRKHISAMHRREARLAWALVALALLVIGGLALVPLGWTIYESLHRHDLRMPWLGRPFVGVTNYVEALGDARFLAALAHTASFTLISVCLEVILGLAAALLLHHAIRLRGLMRTLFLLPWAIPTAVTALLWQFLFDPVAGLAGPVAAWLHLAGRDTAWFSDPVLAWIPLILADVWKTTPFAGLLLLAGLQGIPEELYEAARMDGAGAVRRFLHVTLPMLRPTLLVVLIFRTLDAFRVFDLMYVMTGGGPGTATESIAQYAFTALLQHLRFGYGAALCVCVFLVTAGPALIYIRLLRGGTTGEPQ